MTASDRFPPRRAVRSRAAEPRAVPVRAARASIVVVLVLAIVASVIARKAATAQRQRSNPAVTSTATGSSLSSLDSYAMALLLGGLRGPLVMFLWPSSEAQKSDRNLEDFDTKIEWIRLLQAEFDTVHIFQIWNKAYNISVQMANLGNKYATILDALDYAHKVDSERPNNINLLAAIGGIWFDKLGNSQEAPYFKRRIRAESLPHESRQKLRQDEPGWRRIEFDPVLDAQGRILDRYLKPSGIRLVCDDTGEEYNGAQLQFLEAFQPFPQGLSPFALAFNYYKRSQILQKAGGQRHAQLSDMVIDSRPALSLRNWAEDEWRFARRNEIRAFGIEDPGDLNEQLDGLSAEIPIGFDLPERPSPAMGGEVIAGASTETPTGLIRSAIAAYELSARLTGYAHAEYERHTARFPTNLLLYREHRDNLTALNHMALADRAFLQSLLEPDATARKPLLQTAADEYLRTIDWHNLIVLRHYLPLDLQGELFPPGITRETVNQVPLADRQRMLAPIVQRVREQTIDSAEDIAVHLRAIGRAEARLKSLDAAGVRPAPPAPTTRSARVGDR